jgi:protein-disulfide isomerase
MSTPEATVDATSGRDNEAASPDSEKTRHPSGFLYTLDMSHALRSLGGVAVIALAGCATEAQSSRQPVPSDVVATIGTTQVTLADVDERALAQSASEFGSVTLAQALYESRRMVLDQMVGDQLIDQEATARGLDRAALISSEIDTKVIVPTELEVAAWYKANPGRVQGAPLEQVAAPIRSLLVQERARAARQQYIEGLKLKTKVIVALDPPRIKVDAAARPGRGPADAPIEIIEFSDFECPFCLRAHPTITQVLNTYGRDVRLVYRHYPLPNHPNARPAAEASACANEQGKFWPYHDRLFEHQNELTPPDLKKHASAIGLDVAQFNACFDSNKFAEDVEEDMEAGQAAGVSGTPAFFINGRPLNGAQPFDAFKRVIDEELARR